MAYLENFGESRIDKLAAKVHRLLPGNSAPRTLNILVRTFLRMLIILWTLAEGSADIENERDAVVKQAYFMSAFESIRFAALFFLMSCLLISLVGIISAFLSVWFESKRSTPSKSGLERMVQSLNCLLIYGALMAPWLVWNPSPGNLIQDRSLSFYTMWTFNLVCLVLSLLLTIYSLLLFSLIGANSQDSRALKPSFEFPLALFSFLEDLIILLILKLSISKSVELLVFLICISEIVGVLCLATIVGRAKKGALFIQVFWMAWAALVLVFWGLNTTLEEAALRAVMLAAFLAITVGSFLTLWEKSMIRNATMNSRSRYFNFFVSLIYHDWKRLDNVPVLSNNLGRGSWSFRFSIALWFRSHHASCANVTCCCQQALFDEIPFRESGKGSLKHFIEEVLIARLHVNPSCYLTWAQYIELLSKGFSNQIKALVELDSIRVTQTTVRSRLFDFSVKYEIDNRLRFSTDTLLGKNLKGQEVMRFAASLKLTACYNRESENMVTSLVNLMRALKSSKQDLKSVCSSIWDFDEAKKGYLHSFDKLKHYYWPKAHRMLMRMCLPGEKIENEKKLATDIKRSRQFFHWDDKSFCVVVGLGKTDNGKILLATENCKNVLGLEPLNLIGVDIETLLPSVIRLGHRNAMDGFVRTGKSKFRHDESGVFMMKFNKAMQQVKVYNKLFIKQLTGSPCFISAVTEVRTSGHFLFCDNNGRLLGLSEGFQRATKWYPQLEQTDFNITTIIPHINLDNALDQNKSCDLDQTGTRSILSQAVLYLGLVPVKANEETATGKIDNTLKDYDMALAAQKLLTMSPTKKESLNVHHMQTRQIYENFLSKHGCIPSRKFEVVYSANRMGLANVNYFGVMVHKVLPAIVKHQLTDHPVFVFLFRISLLKLFVRRLLHRKDINFYEFLFATDKNKLNSKLRMQRVVNNIKAIGGFRTTQNSMDSASICVSNLNKKCNLKMAFLWRTSLFVFTCALKILVVHLGIFYNMSTKLYGMFSNAYPHLKRKGNMLAMIYFMPYAIFKENSAQVSQQVFANNGTKSLFTTNINTIFHSGGMSEEASDISNVFLSYQRNTFVEKLLYPQFSELPSDFRASAIPSIEIEDWASSTLISSKANVLDLYVSLNYILNKILFTPLDFELYRGISLKIFERQSSYISRTPIFDELAESLKSLMYSTVASCIAVLMMSLFICFHMAKSHFHWRLGLSFLSGIQLKKGHAALLQKLFPNIKIPSSRQNDKLGSSHNSNVLYRQSLEPKKVFAFMWPFLFLLCSAIAIVICTVLLRIRTNQNIVDQTSQVTMRFLSLDFLVIKSLITLQDLSIKPLISANEFQSEMAVNFHSIFSNYALGLHVSEFFDTKSDLCPQLTGMKFPHCETVMSGILKEGYATTFNFFVHTITQMLTDNKPLFSNGQHENLYQLVLAFIYTNRIILNDIQLALESTLMESQKINLLLILAIIAIMIVLSIAFRRILHNRLVRNWRKTIPILAFISPRTAKVNSLLRRFVQGDCV